MIIYIDGTYGCGKSSVSEKLHKYLKDSELFNADEYYMNVWIKNINNKLESDISLLYKVMASPTTVLVNNRYFLEDYSEYIKSKISLSKYQIINMCLLNDTYFKHFYSKLLCYDYIHIVLSADKQVIIDRASKQENRNMDIVTSFYDENQRYIKNYPEAYIIDVNNLSEDDVFRNCLKLIK